MKNHQSLALEHDALLLNLVTLVSGSVFGGGGRRGAGPTVAVDRLKLALYRIAMRRAIRIRARKRSHTPFERFIRFIGFHWQSRLFGYEWTRRTSRQSTSLHSPLSFSPHCLAVLS